MVLYSNSFEGGTDTVAISTTNSGGSSGAAWHQVSATSGTTTYSVNTRSSLSSMCMRCLATGTATCRALWFTLPGGPYDAIYVRCYINQAVRSGSVQILRAMDTAGNTSHGYVGIDSTGHITISDKNLVTRATSTMTITTGTWYRIEWNISNADPTTGAMSCRIYSTVEGLTADETISASDIDTSTNGDINRVFFGFTTAVANTNDLYVDDCAVTNNEWIGPVDQLNIYGNRNFINPQAVYRM